MGRPVPCILLILLLFCLKVRAQQAFQQNSTRLPPRQTNWLLPPNFYNQHLSFFCKKESQLQKASGLNLYLRLGSKPYVDYLERKPNAFKP